MRNAVVSIVISMLLFAGCTEENTRNAVGRAEGIDMSKMELQAVKIVREGLEDADPAIRGNAIEVVANTKRRDLMPKVIKLLEDENVAVRFSAAVAVGDLKYSAGEYTVKPLLEDANANVRMAAAYALAKLGKTGEADKIRMLATSPDQTVRSNAAMLLGRLADKNDLSLLYEIQRAPDSAPRAKLQAVESIAMLGDESIYKKKLWALMISKYADDRVIGIRGMAALGTTDAENAVATMLDDDILEVRLCAAGNLGKMGNRTGEIEVIRYFTQGSPNLDEQVPANVFATMAIGRIGGRTLPKFLDDIMKSESKAIQLIAAQSTLQLTGSR